MLCLLAPFLTRFLFFSFSSISASVFLLPLVLLILLSFFHFKVFVAFSLSFSFDSYSAFSSSPLHPPPILHVHPVHVSSTAPHPVHHSTEHTANGLLPILTFILLILLILLLHCPSSATSSSSSCFFVRPLPFLNSTSFCLAFLS